MKTPEPATQAPKELLNDLHNLVAEAEKMMGDSITEHTADAVSALRIRFDAAQERLVQLCGVAKERVFATAKCTDKAVRDNPYQSLLVAGGVGLLVGVLLGRRSSK